MNVLCIYHQDDLDGIASAALLSVAYGNGDPNNDSFRAYPYTYSKVEKYFPSKDENSVLLDKIFIVDVSYPGPDMKVLKEECENRSIELIWIDHHVSSIKDSELLGYTDIHGIRWDLREEGYNLGACYSVFSYLCSEGYKKDILLSHVKTFIIALATYDGWDKEGHMFKQTNINLPSWEDILAVQEYYKMKFMSYDIYKNPNDSVYAIAEYIKECETIEIFRLLTEDTTHDLLKHKQFVMADLCRIAAFETNVLGHKTIAINAPIFQSAVFKSVLNDSIDLMMAFCFDPKNLKYRVSFYSTKDNVNCSEIAQIFGGGGHPQAAGCHWSIDFMAKFLRDGELLEDWKTYI